MDRSAGFLSCHENRNSYLDWDNFMIFYSNVTLLFYPNSEPVIKNCQSLAEPSIIGPRYYDNADDESRINPCCGSQFLRCKNTS